MIWDDCVEALRETQLQQLVREDGEILLRLRLAGQGDLEEVLQFTPCSRDESSMRHAFREPQSEAFRTAASHGLACAPQVAAQAACLAAQALHALLRGSCCECRFRLGSGTQDAMDSEHSPDLAIAAAGAKRREANDSAQFQLPKQRPRGHVCCRSCRTGGEGCC